MSLPELLQTGSLEAVEADTEAAWAWLDVAGTHLASVELVLPSDPVLAYQAVYEAARKAVVAHMAASGYRATNQRGAHKTVAAYARAVFPASSPPASTTCGGAATASSPAGRRWANGRSSATSRTRGRSWRSCAPRCRPTRADYSA